MKKFIMYVGAFAVVTLIIMVALDCAYTQIYERSTTRTKFQMLKKLKDKEVAFIFVGSSRVHNGIVPSIIEKKTGKKALNLGFQAAKLKDIYTVLQLLQEYNLKYEKVFIQIDYIFDADGRSISLPYEMAPFIRDNLVTREYYKQYPDFLPIYYIPFYRYSAFDHKIGIREMMMSLIGKKTNVASDSGYAPLTPGDCKGGFELPATIKKRNPDYDKIRAYCIKNQLNVVFYCAPFLKETKNLNYIKALKKKIPDLHDYSQALDDPSMFNNNSHLSDYGSRTFTTILTKDLILQSADNPNRN